MRGRALPAQEAIRDGIGRAQEDAIGDVQGAERSPYIYRFDLGLSEEAFSQACSTESEATEQR